MTISMYDLDNNSSLVIRNLVLKEYHAVACDDSGHFYIAQLIDRYRLLENNYCIYIFDKDGFKKKSSMLAYPISAAYPYILCSNKDQYYLIDSEDEFKSYPLTGRGRVANVGRELHYSPTEFITYTRDESIHFFRFEKQNSETYLTEVFRFFMKDYKLPRKYPASYFQDCFLRSTLGVAPLRNLVIFFHDYAVFGKSYQFIVFDLCSKFVSFFELPYYKKSALILFDLLLDSILRIFLFTDLCCVFTVNLVETSKDKILEYTPIHPDDVFNNEYFILNYPEYLNRSYRLRKHLGLESDSNQRIIPKGLFDVIVTTPEGPDFTFLFSKDSLVGFYIRGNYVGQRE